MAALALLLLLPALPASATGGYSPPQRVSPCEAYGDVVAVADTSLWGVVGCVGSMRLVHRSPGGTWSSRPLPYRGCRVEHTGALVDVSAGRTVEAR